jgi:hypothetical protein
MTVTVGGNLIERLGSGCPEGVTVGATSTELVGMHGVAVAQAAAITSPATTVATTSQYGYTQTQADAMQVAVNSILTALRNKGIIASA